MAYLPTSPNNPVAFISASIRQAPSAAAPRISALPGVEQTLLHNLSDTVPYIEILTLGVLPAYQQRGLASLLVRRVYEHFRERANDLNDGTLVRANVATSNASALSFYKRMGMGIASDVIYNLYRTCTYGSRDAYLVVGFIYF